MYHLLSIFFLLGSVELVLGNALPRTTNPPEKRDVPLMTLNIGAISNDQKTTNGVATPAGTSLIIYPTDAKNILDDGIDHIMGPDLPKNLQDSVKSECADVTDAKCLGALDKVFGNGNDSLVNRAQIDWLSASRGAGQVGAVFAGLVTFLTAKWEAQSGAAGPPPLDVHPPSSALSQINGASTTSEMVLKTADNDPKAVSATVAATQTVSTSGASGRPLSTITVDGNGHAKGDIEIDAPNNDVANAINDFFKKGNCQAPPSKRGTELDKRDDTVIQCLLNEFADLLNAMGSNGALGGLAATAMQVARTFPLPTFDDPQYAAAFGQALVLGANTIPHVLLGIPQDQIVATDVFIFLLSVANNNHALMEEGKLVLQTEKLLKFEEDFEPVCPAKGSDNYPKCDNFVCQGKDEKCTVSPMKPCPCDSSKCPTDASEEPFCETCDGQAAKCTSGENKDCDCIGGGKLYIHPEGSPGWVDTLQQIVTEIGIYTPGSDTSSSTPKCDMNSFSNIQYPLFNDGNGNGVYKNFCNTVSKDPRTKLAQMVDAHGNVIPPKGKRSIEMRMPPPDPNAENGYAFYLEWTGGDGSCASDCGESFDAIVDSPCAHLGGEQNDMANAASLDTGCGIYSYKINAPPPVPTICPDPGNKNLAQNRCKDKCMGKGWGKCDPDQPGITNAYTCYCNDGPCGGQKCGDGEKMDNLTNKGTKCPLQQRITFADDDACDIACPGGIYGTRGTCFVVDPNTHRSVLDKNGNKQHRMISGFMVCSCDADPCKNANCYDRIAAESM